MQPLMMERHGSANTRAVPNEESLAQTDVRVKLHTVGVCSSDVHYYKSGRLAPAIVREPMLVGQEAAGTVVDIGSGVHDLNVGDRVCIEPGIPDAGARVTQMGLYNLDQQVRSWASPSMSERMRTSVIHPAQFTHRLPENVSFGEGAMAEPLAAGLHAATRARIKPGDLGVVIGADSPGLLTAIAAIAAGCAKVLLVDTVQTKLDVAARLGLGPALIPVNASKRRLSSLVAEAAPEWGADVIFECSGNQRAAEDVFDLVCPGGAVVFVGMPGAPITYDVVAAQVKEARVEHVFRHAHMFARALALMETGRVNVKPLIARTFAFEQSVEALEHAAKMPPGALKVQIQLPH